MLCGTLVPPPGIEPASPALEARSVNHWTAREVQVSTFSIYIQELLKAEDLALLMKKHITSVHSY